MPALKAGAIYFLILFALGWVLGPIRALWATPRFGPMIGMLLEAVIMLMAMIIAAKWAIRRFDVLGTLAGTISMGLIALGLLLPAELAGVLWIRRLSVRDYLGTFLSPVVALLMFLLFAAMPTLVARLGNREQRAGRASPARSDR